MSHRRKQRRKEKEVGTKRATEMKARKEHPISSRVGSHARKAIIVGLLLSVLVLLAFVAPRPPQEYVTCVDANTPPVEHTHTYVQVRLGNISDYRFIPIPSYASDPDHNVGLSATCAWVLHVHDYRGTDERLPDGYARVHVESPYAHTYALGDFFRVWSLWLGTEVYLGPDGVSHYRGNVQVYVYQSDSLSQSWEYRMSGDPRQVPLIDGTYVLVVLPYPYSG